MLTYRQCKILHLRQHKNRSDFVGAVFLFRPLRIQWMVSDKLVLLLKGSTKSHVLKCCHLNRHLKLVHFFRSIGIISTSSLRNWLTRWRIYLALSAYHVLWWPLFTSWPMCHSTQFCLQTKCWVRVQSPSRLPNAHSECSLGPFQVSDIFGHFDWIETFTNESFVAVFVALSTFGAVNGILLTSSRLFYAGACEGQMPEILTMIQIQRFTPTPAVLIMALLSMLYLTVSDIFALINYVGFATWVSVDMNGMYLQH